MKFINENTKLIWKLRQQNAGGDYVSSSVSRYDDMAAVWVCLVWLGMLVGYTLVIMLIH